MMQPLVTNPYRRIGSFWGTLPLALLLAAAPSTGLAVDIADCLGTTVPRGQVGNLVVDLDCTASNKHIVLERGATLQLNGHVLAGASSPILCSEARCTVIGPGTITATNHAIDAFGSLRVENVSISGGQHCVEASRRVRVEGCTITGCDIGINGSYRATVLDSTISNGQETGILAVNVVLRNVEVSGNGGTGVHAFPLRRNGRTIGGRLRARNSSITDNGNSCPPDETVGCFDLRGRRVRVRDTTFGTCSGDCLAR